ncbi:MAG: motility protein A [Candidatus Dadabacteria bacterium]|nr:MAG: motility protein A [Candidatus Dadabacteria bacterium]
MNNTAETLETIPVKENIAFREAKLDSTMLIGVGLGFVLVLLAVMIGGDPLSFINPFGFVFVLGGTITAVMIQFSLPQLRESWSALKSAMFREEHSSLERILYFVEMARRVKDEGLLILDREALVVRDPYLAKALEITVDGASEEDIRRILETEMRFSSERKRRCVQVLETMAAYAPAFGLIGTIIGLSNLLGNLPDSASLGGDMAVALMTTFYGALLANLVFLPIAGKLKLRSEEDALIKVITIEGVLCLARGENAIFVEQKLQSFLPSY